MTKVNQSKISIGKTKKTFVKKEVFTISFFGEKLYYTCYPNMRSSSIKHFSNKQEKTINNLHLKEYREYETYGLRIRGKRKNSLPDVNDDYPSYLYKIAKSWKHNSKRSQQYFK